MKPIIDQLQSIQTNVKKVSNMWIGRRWTKTLNGFVQLDILAFSIQRSLMKADENKSNRNMVQFLLNRAFADVQTMQTRMDKRWFKCPKDDVAGGDDAIDADKIRQEIEASIQYVHDAISQLWNLPRV